MPKGEPKYAMLSTVARTTFNNTEDKDTVRQNARISHCGGMKTLQSLMTLLKRLFHGTKFFDLKRVAKAIAEKNRVKVDRNASRNQWQLACWFLENWHLVQSYVTSQQSSETQHVVALPDPYSVDIGVDDHQPFDFEPFKFIFDEDMLSTQRTDLIELF